MRGATGYFAGGQSAMKYFKYYGADPKRIHLHNFTSLHQEDINKNSYLMMKKLSERENRDDGNI